MSQRNSPTESPLEAAMQTFWRATIMLGTVTVGGMAFYLYGPSQEKASAMFDGVVARIHDMTATDAPAAGLPAPASAGLTTGLSTGQAAGLTPLGSPQAGLAPVAPALALAPLAEPALPVAEGDRQAPANMPQLYAELSQLGAGDPQLEPWGNSGNLHRFCCSALTPSGFRRHFDAIRPTPEEAVLVALSQVREWRAASGQPINR